ncbi:hypothetical protein HK096_003856 [Nowakowskiella sp. JEL0078]|nr:hypothetical protein HK096_003856 [Nowakowskiella sp. JEL0078]
MKIYHSGVALKDLTAINELKDRKPDGNLNIHKQYSDQNQQRDPQLITFILSQSIFEEDSFHTRSLELEPQE